MGGGSALRQRYECSVFNTLPTKKKRKKAARSADSLSYQSRIHSMEEKDFSVNIIQDRKIKLLRSYLSMWLIYCLYIRCGGP